jgi:hypothetical protein
MGVRADRAAYLAMVLGAVIALLSRMTWIYVWRVDGILSFISVGPGNIAGRDVVNVTSSDGDAVLILACIYIGVALVSLNGPPIRRMCGLALTAAAGLATAITGYAIVQAIRGTVDYGLRGFSTGDFEIATPLLASFVIGLLITGLGVLIAMAPNEAPISNELAEDGALQW